MNLKDLAGTTLLRVQSNLLFNAMARPLIDDELMYLHKVQYQSTKAPTKHAADANKCDVQGAVENCTTEADGVIRIPTWQRHKIVANIFHCTRDLPRPCDNSGPNEGFWHKYYFVERARASRGEKPSKKILTDVPAYCRVT